MVILFRIAKFVQSIVAIKRTLSYGLKDMVYEFKLMLHLF